MFVIEISQGRLFWQGVKRFAMKSAPHGEESGQEVRCVKSRAAENPADRFIMRTGACFFSRVMPFPGINVSHCHLFVLYGSCYMPSRVTLTTQTLHYFT